MPADAHSLSRFLEAQSSTYTAALAELRGGRKYTHWMWFIFPQVKSLGSSRYAEFYGIGSLAEARAYLAHEVLGPRLVECTEALLSHHGLSARTIMGTPDDLKLRSSFTLFAEVAEPESVFQAGLEHYFEGQADERTLAILERWSGS